MASNYNMYIFDLQGTIVAKIASNRSNPAVVSGEALYYTRKKLKDFYEISGSSARIKRETGQMPVQSRCCRVELAANAIAFLCEKARRSDETESEHLLSDGSQATSASDGTAGFSLPFQGRPSGSRRTAAPFRYIRPAPYRIKSKRRTVI